MAGKRIKIAIKKREQRENIAESEKYIQDNKGNAASEYIGGNAKRVSQTKLDALRREDKEATPKRKLTFLEKASAFVDSLPKYEGSTTDETRRNIQNFFKKPKTKK